MHHLHGRRKVGANQDRQGTRCAHGPAPTGGRFACMPASRHSRGPEPCPAPATCRTSRRCPVRASPHCMGTCANTHERRATAGISLMLTHTPGPNHPHVRKQAQTTHGTTHMRSKRKQCMDTTSTFTSGRALAYVGLGFLLGPSCRSKCKQRLDTASTPGCRGREPAAAPPARRRSSHSVRPCPQP
jgi:hypothetical protein